ncbi:MAG: hypothetical protein IPK87_13895 [Planctomycetes bacterium]|nr:hypothetical protein [Planctomycetota bacterium]
MIRRRWQLILLAGLSVALSGNAINGYQGEWKIVYPPYSVTKDGVTGTITWGEYEHFSTSMEHNENATMDDDFGGRLNLTLTPLDYAASTDCTNDSEKKVWVEDGATCTLSLDDETTHDTTFSCTGKCAGEGGCDFEYTSRVYGHWKGAYEGVDAKLHAEGSFTAICMAGKTHEAFLSLVSGDGNTVISDEVEVTLEGGQVQKGEASAGGEVKGVDVKVVAGNELKKAVGLRRKMAVTTKTTDATLWDRKFITTTEYKLHMAVNQDPVVRRRELTWSWIQNYNAFKLQPNGDPADTAIRRGNTEKVTWNISTPTYTVSPYCGVRPADQGCNPAGRPQDVPEIPARGASRTALVFVPGAADDAAFEITVAAGTTGTLTLDEVSVAETGIVEDFTAVVTAFDPTLGTARISSTVPFMLRMTITGHEYGTDTIRLTRFGGMPDPEDGYSTETSVAIPVHVVNRGFIVAEIEAWPSGETAALGGAMPTSQNLQIRPGSQLGLTLDVGAVQADDLPLYVASESGQIAFEAPLVLDAGATSVVIWLTTNGIDGVVDLRIRLNGRDLVLHVSEAEQE